MRKASFHVRKRLEESSSSPLISQKDDLSVGISTVPYWIDHPAHTAPRCTTVLWSVAGLHRAKSLSQLLIRVACAI